jgi:hypothetical protein
MTITYEEALATLQSMFSDAWTRDLLDEVLRHEKGHMENTVDLILRHGDKDPKILVDQLAAGIDPLQNAAALDEALARQLSMGGTANGPGRAGGGTAAPRPRAGKGTPTTLPDDFLRIPGYTPPPHSSLSDDEALARMLQDELFTEELRRNPDFAHLARGRSNVRMVSAPGGAAADGPNPALVAANKIGEMARNFTANVNRSLAAASASHGHNNASLSSNADQDPMSPNIMKKLSEMGDSAKRRLQLLAAQFNATAAGADGTMMSGSGTTNPTTSEARRSEFRGLLDDDDNDNMELAARKDL